VLVVWLWIAMSLVATVVTLLLRRRAKRRANEQKNRATDHPVRLLAEARLRNQWLWLPVFVGGLVLGILVLLRDVLPFELPQGVSVIEILALMGTAMVVQVLDVADDERVDRGRWMRK
jgi:hypothetical protein